MSGTWKSNVPELIKRHHQGAELGLHAAALNVQRAVKKGLRVGYTSGEWVSGASEEAVEISQAERQGMNWAIRVGTNLESNRDWEFGHFNLFLKRWVRVEKWRPALVESKDSANRVFSRVYKKVLAGR